MLKLKLTQNASFALHTTTIKVDCSAFQELTQVCNDASKDLSGIDAGGLIFVYQPISVNVIDQGTSKGGNTLGLQRINQQWFGFAITWNQEADDKVAYQMAKVLGDRIEELAYRRGTFLPYRFMSDAGPTLDVIGGYGTENVKKLHSVAATYDPKRVFQKLQPGGFKLHSA